MDVTQRSNHASDDLTRRDALKLAGVAVGATLLGALRSARAADAPPSPGRKVIVFGAHPDDPETGCGGVMALLAAAGHEVVAAYLTRGEAGIEGKSQEDAARIRTAEAAAACEILHARPVFLGQIDGACEVNPARIAAVEEFLRAEKPDVILTHWPIDTHADHRACSILVYGAWINLGRTGSLFFYEVMTGVQTQNFAPTDYVDITAVAAQKLAACLAHRTQLDETWYADYHGRMETFRGRESGHERAEAFVRHNQNKETAGGLPV